MAAIVVLILLLLKGMSRRVPQRPPSSSGVEDMVRCEVCGVNLPRSEALMSRGCFYCCEEHRQGP
ncbi:MAG: PP0621 family protein [Thiobacillaceae bacterium]|nr:PP0621 family protein [Thiobacillaceae bacterium]